jgi:hypothetical protein
LPVTTSLHCPSLSLPGRVQERNNELALWALTCAAEEHPDCVRALMDPIVAALVALLNTRADMLDSVLIEFYQCLGTHSAARKHRTHSTHAHKQSEAVAGLLPKLPARAPHRATDCRLWRR